MTHRNWREIQAFGRGKRKCRNQTFGISSVAKKSQNSRSCGYITRTVAFRVESETENRRFLISGAGIAKR